MRDGMCCDCSMTPERRNEKFINDLGNMPFDSVEKVVFQGMTVLIYFNTGNILKATAKDPDQLELLKKSFEENNVTIHYSC